MVTLQRVSPMTDSEFSQPDRPSQPVQRRVGLSKRDYRAPSMLSTIKGRTSSSVQTPDSMPPKATKPARPTRATTQPTNGVGPVKILISKKGKKGKKGKKAVEDEKIKDVDVDAPPLESSEDDSDAVERKRESAMAINPTKWEKKKDIEKESSAGTSFATSSRATRSRAPTKASSPVMKSQESPHSSVNTDDFGNRIGKKAKTKYGSTQSRKLASSQASEKKSTRDAQSSPEPPSFNKPGEIASTPKKRKRPGADPEPEPKLQVLSLACLDDTPVTKRAPKLKHLGKVIEDSDIEDDEESPMLVLGGGMDNLLDSPEPEPSPRERDPNLAKYFAATQAVSNFNLDYLDSDLLLTQAQAILGQDAFTSKPVQYEPEEPYHFTQTQLPSTCPMCHAPVDPEELKAKGPMNVSAQERFCQSHQRKTAQDEWKQQGYPEINWATLPKRLEKYHKNIEKWIKGEDSHYRQLYSTRLAAGQDRTLRKLTSNLIPGYYGSRGSQVIGEFIMQKHTRLLKKVAPRDALISKRGVTNYMQAVLVPEITTLLIMEDMSVDAERAREILDESVVMGELLQEEVKDVHVSKRKGRVGDSEEDSDEFDELA